MILFGSTLSPFVRKVAAYCHERGIAYEPMVSPPGQPSPEFLAASPMRKIPAIRDGDYTLADSSAILHYLEAKYPDGGLLPAEPELRGRAVFFDEWADTLMVGCLGKIFFNRIVGPLFLGMAGDEAVAAKTECDELPPLLDYLESVAPDAGGFLVGDRLTIADLAIASPFANLAHLDIAIDEGRYPRLRAYAERILARDSFRSMVERERTLIARARGA